MGRLRDERRIERRDVLRQIEIILHLELRRQRKNSGRIPKVDAASRSCTSRCRKRATSSATTFTSAAPRAVEMHVDSFAKTRSSCRRNAFRCVRNVAGRKKIASWKAFKDNPFSSLARTIQKKFALFSCITFPVIVYTQTSNTHASSLETVTQKKQGLNRPIKGEDPCLQQRKPPRRRPL